MAPPFMVDPNAGGDVTQRPAVNLTATVLDAPAEAPHADLVALL
jgi:hypothetical protein